MSNRAANEEFFSSGESGIHAKFVLSSKSMVREFLDHVLEAHGTGVLDHVLEAHGTGKELSHTLSFATLREADEEHDSE